MPAIIAVAALAGAAVATFHRWCSVGNCPVICWVGRRILPD